MAPPSTAAEQPRLLQPSRRAGRPRREETRTAPNSKPPVVALGGIGDSDSRGHYRLAHPEPSSGEHQTQKMGIQPSPGTFSDSDMCPSAPARNRSPPAVLAFETQTPLQSPTRLAGTRQRHPLGGMFRPELDKAGVLSVVSEVLCQPGFTAGPTEEKRLLRSVATRRLDVRTVSRLLRWLGGRRAEGVLRDRGQVFVGPRMQQQLQQQQQQPYTTGLGMTRLLEMVAANHPAGTRFIVCFSSTFDACAGIIEGVLVDDGSCRAEPDCEPWRLPAPAVVGGYSEGGSESVTNVVASECGTSSTCSLSDHDHDHDHNEGDAFFLENPDTERVRVGGSVRTPAAVAAAARDDFVAPRSGGSPRGAGAVWRRRSAANAGRVGVRGGDDALPSSGAVRRHRGGFASAAVVPLLLDEIPKHRSCVRRGSSGGGGGGGGEGLFGEMAVPEWVEAYGECDGPMLAAWAFPGAPASSMEVGTMT